MAEDFGYINARIRAMKSRLFSISHYEELLSSKDLGGLLQYLRKTHYGEDIAKAETKEKRELDVLNTAYMMNLERTFRKILSFSSGEPRRLFQIILGKYDIYNIKTILRGKIRGVSDEDIRSSLLPAGLLDEVRLSRLLEEKDASSVLELLGTWALEFPFVIGKELMSMVREGAISQAEYYLENAYLKWARERLNGRKENDRLLIELLDSLTDIRNIMACLILLKEGIKPRGRILLLEGGRLRKSVTSALLECEEIESAYKVLKETEYGQPLKEKKEIDLSYYERALEKIQLSKVLSLKYGDPLGIGLGLSFIWAKENEIINLRTISYGISFNLSKLEIKERLVIYS